MAKARSGRTLLMSLAYGFAGFSLSVRYFDLGSTYRAEPLISWLLPSLGAFAGFVGASCVHEAAHFLTARLLRAHVHRIQIGSGKLLKKFRLMDTPIEVNESLRSGLVFYSITDLHRVRTRLFLITVAAPIASVLLAGLSMVSLVCIHPREETGSFFWHFLFPFIAGWTLPCLLFLPGVLLPYRYHYAGRKMQTDAMALFTICRLTDPEVAAKVTDARARLEIT